MEILAVIKNLSNKPTNSDIMWVVGLTVASILGLLILGWCLLKFRKWLKSDVQVSSSGSAFSLSELKEMHGKGQISTEEFTQLKQAYLKSKF